MVIQSSGFVRSSDKLNTLFFLLQCTKDDQSWQDGDYGLSPSEKVVFISFNESPLNVMKNTFYFMPEALFVLKIKI